MAAPRVTQQFIENIRSTALAPPKARITQQFAEIIRSINIAAANDALAETVAASDAFFAGGLLPPAALAETVAVTDNLIGAQMIVNVPGARGDCSLTVIVPGSPA